MGSSGAAKYNSNSAYQISDNFLPSIWAHVRNFNPHGIIFVAVGFLAGCMAGAVAGNYVGFSGVLLPGMILFLYTMND